MKNISKSFLITLLVVLCSGKAYSQSNEPYIYAELGGGDGTHHIYKAALNAIFNGQISISLNYYYASHRAQNLPSDYNPNGFFGTYWPQQSLSMTGVSFGRVFFLNNPYIRFVVKGGIAAGVIETPVSFVPVPASTWFSSPGEYTFSTRNNTVAGVVLDPTIEFPLSRGFGFSVGLYTNINAVSSVFGIDACIIFGRVRGRTRWH